MLVDDFKAAVTGLTTAAQGVEDAVNNLATRIAANPNSGSVPDSVTGPATTLLTQVAATLGSTADQLNALAPAPAGTTPTAPATQAKSNNVATFQNPLK